LTPERYENHPKRTGKNKADNGSKWLSPKKREAIYSRDEWRCLYCQKHINEMKPAIPSVSLTLDHLVPTELGGTNEARNLVTACKTCNSIKSNRTLKQFLLFLESNGHDPEEVKNRVRRHTRRKLKNYKERINGNRVNR
jgi:5-methylcytosine-specific restriction endonuclease McrA